MLLTNKSTVSNFTLINASLFVNIDTTGLFVETLVRILFNRLLIPFRMHEDSCTSHWSDKFSKDKKRKEASQEAE